jgi:hypothetical protein
MAQGARQAGLLVGNAEGFAEAFATDDRHGGRLLRSRRGPARGLIQRSPAKRLKSLSLLCTIA